jgi:hypothetical protein
VRSLIISTTEELDRFRLRDSGSYSDSEVEEFPEVFYTMWMKRNALGGVPAT